ncbi:hypothetical protein GJ744_006156 [Endocarpon pusillum]|uniref:Uncharacterized protein n=1 Tax=Endocarpon pusillum TaxID=364733 RepID=A0A8H7E0V8_9EURO|nr:hypothetical protein GJ744_006156 [Endocarpon pusillum]
MASMQTSTGTSQQISRPHARTTQAAVELTSGQGRGQAQQQRGQEQHRDRAQERDNPRWTQLLQQLEVQSKALMAEEAGNARENERPARPEEPSQTHQKLAAEFLIDLMFDMKTSSLLDYQRIGEILRRWPADQSQIMSDLRNILKGKGPARRDGKDQASELNDLIDRLKRVESQIQQHGRGFLASQKQRGQLVRQREQLRHLLPQVQDQNPVLDAEPGKSRPTEAEREFQKLMQEAEAEFQLLDSLPTKDPALILACRVGKKLERLAQIHETEAGIQAKYGREAQRPQGQSLSRQAEGPSLKQRVELLVLVEQAEKQNAFLSTVPKRGQMARRYDSTGLELRMVKARIETLQTRDQALIAARQLREILDRLSQMAETPQQRPPARSQQRRRTERTAGSEPGRACCLIS